MPPSLGSRGCGGGSRCWDGDGCRRGNLHVGHHGRGGHGHRLGHRRVVELDVPDLFCRDEDLPVVHERDLEGKHGTNECPDERIWFEATRVGQLIHMALELGEHVVRALLERFALHTLGVGDRLLRVRGLLLLGEVVLCRAQLLARFVVCLCVVHARQEDGAEVFDAELEVRASSVGGRDELRLLARRRPAEHTGQEEWTCRR
mmetsp:Transcript_20374/g.44232  ORF Transcript_20374/g.44232 Transcript_20374/m.44232 type:complete len:203 (-) Transcript_20374:1637-2245(-)